MDATTSNMTGANIATDALKCDVCLEPYLQPVELPCRHTFCYLCVKGIMQQSERCAICRQDIPLNYLDSAQPIAFQQPTVAFDGSYQWFYGGCNGWWQYDDRTSVAIEDAYKKGVTQCEVLIAGVLYTVDFPKMLQFQKCDPLRRRIIKRDLVTIPKIGVSGIRLDQKAVQVAKKIPISLLKKDSRNFSSTRTLRNSSSTRTLRNPSTRTLRSSIPQKVTRRGRVIKLPKKFTDYLL